MSIAFPPAWLWLVDEAIPAWVKQSYSPRESWKSKPFEKQDAIFFSKGVNELSELFTEDRPREFPAYLNHPRFRSAYLLYFLPLQAAKFITLFQLHPAALQAALEHGRKSGALRVADLGAGPGTASIALLLALSDPRQALSRDLPPIELDWFDTSRGIMEDGKQLALQLSSHFPRLRGRVTLRTHVDPWWKAASLPGELSLTLMGHVLNESHGPRPGEGTWTRLWSELLGKARGGGLLLVEPAARSSSQYLSRLRDQLLESEVLPAQPSSLWGPCLHAGACPLSEGRDWCHFSVPAQIPGKWFSEFSRHLGSERQWVKFSYLWLASASNPAPLPTPSMRRVISDPLGKHGGPSEVLICEPEKPGRMKVPARKSIHRGDVIKK